MSRRTYMSGPATVTVTRLDHEQSERVARDGRLYFRVHITGLCRTEDNLPADYTCNVGLPYTRLPDETSELRWLSMARAGLHFAISDGWDGDALPYDELGVLVTQTR